MFEADRVLEVVGRVPDAVIDGGWGIDALAGHATRPHDDLDLVVPLERCDEIADALEPLGFAIALDERPTRVVLADGDDRVDLHLVSPSPRGMTQALPGGTQFTYVLDGTRGTIGDHSVSCLNAPMQILTHSGYEPDENDRADMAVVSSVSKESLPPPYASHARAEVRRAAVTDVAALIVVRQRSWEAAYRGLMPDGVIDAMDLGAAWADWYSLVRNPPSPRHRVLVAGAAGEVHGLAVVGASFDATIDAERVGEVNLLYVDPTAWDRQVGATLFRAAIAELETQGFAQFSLWTLRENQRARSFYERFGWRADGAEQTIDHPAGSYVEVRYRS